MRVAERDTVGTREGHPGEELPDPFAPETPPPADAAEQPSRRRRWPIVLYSVTGLIFITILWLVITAPLSRSLEPLPDPALLLESAYGRPIALRRAIKAAA